MQAVRYRFARLTLPVSEMPCANPQAMAEDSVQPVPCVFGLWMRGAGSQWNWPSV